jgi:hypothetical protein
MDKNPTTDRNYISHVQPHERARRILAAAAIAIAGAAISTFGASSAEAAVLSAGVTANITTGAVNPPYGGSKCADVASGSVADRTKVQIYDCNAAPNQQFELSGRTIFALGGQTCLDVVNNGTTPGTLVQSFHCNGTTAQQWGYNNGKIQNLFSSLCLDVAFFDNGTQLKLNKCDNAVRWQIK